MVGKEVLQGEGDREPVVAGRGAAWPGLADSGCDPAAGDQRGGVLLLTQGVWRHVRRSGAPPQGAREGEGASSPGGLGPDAGQADPERRRPEKLLSPSRRLQYIDDVRGRVGILKRRSCRALGQHRATQRRVPCGRDDEGRLVADMIELARQQAGCWPRRRSFRQADRSDPLRYADRPAWRKNHQCTNIRSGPVAGGRSARRLPGLSGGRTSGALLGLEGEGKGRSLDSHGARRAAVPWTQA